MSLNFFKAAPPNHFLIQPRSCSVLRPFVQISGLSFGEIRIVKFRSFCRPCFREKFLWAWTRFWWGRWAFFAIPAVEVVSSGFWATARIEKEKRKKMDITEVSMIHHACIVLLGLWLLAEFNWCHPVAYLVSLIYLYLVICQLHPVFQLFNHFALLIRGLLHCSELPVLLKSGFQNRCFCIWLINGGQLLLFVEYLWMR